MSISNLESYKGELIERLYDCESQSERECILLQIETVEEEINKLY